MLDPAVFKAYDVRGIHPQDFDESGARALGRAYARHLEPTTVAVGRDMRLSAPAMADALIEGLVAEGVRVEDIGQVGTEMLYFAVASRELDGGLMVTASHNPAQYIGAKIVRRRAVPVGGDSGLSDIGRLAVQIAASVDEPDRDGGSVSSVDVWDEYTDALRGFIDSAKLRPMTVVFDAGNGMGGRMIERLLGELPITAHTYRFEPDGSFPDGEPNPLLPENREFILAKVREHGADLGVAWDGDADRCFFVDDTGTFVDGDFTTALMARHMLAQHGSAKVIYDVRASRAVPDTINASGGTPIASRVGHAFIKHRMAAEEALYGGEVSGHYYFRHFYNVDTGVVPVLVMLQLISEAGESLSSLLAPFRSRYFISGEINSTVDDVPLKLQQLKERYADGTITHVDGVSIDYDDWHFNVRASNTEPLLRLNLEAFDQATMEARRDEVLALIRSDSRARMVPS